MAIFEIAYKKTMGHELGFINDPTDRGGMTINGISRKNWPGWKGWERIDRIIARVGTNPDLIEREVKLDGVLMDMIFSFYETNFWNVNNLGHLKSQAIANEVFDTGVNMHTETAAEFLQEALNLCNRNGKTYPDVGVDGIMGPKGETIRTCNTVANEKEIVTTLNFLQAEKYLKIMRNSKSQEKWWPGWMNRAIASW